ncbi:Small ubiquitin-related modifier 1 [Hibiscus syriacus]|uniref:Small ubiquitin-related modifier n=1 Tax=Hibiscus syriacus TaxID=106335 RepID=A0A6A3CPY9_HIBSY|nr:Small ubiquitin-related modifier 1 [Hibiscus syriacus]
MSGPQEEDKKPGDQSAAHINLKVKGQDGNEVFFRIKRSTQLKKLMNAYCDRQSVDFNLIAFLFDGRRLRGEQTPDEVSFRFLSFRGTTVLMCTLQSGICSKA